MAMNRVGEQEHMREPCHFSLMWLYLNICRLSCFFVNAYCPGYLFPYESATRDSNKHSYPYVIVAYLPIQPTTHWCSLSCLYK